MTHSTRLAATLAFALLIATVSLSACDLTGGSEVEDPEVLTWDTDEDQFISLTLTQKSSGQSSDQSWMRTLASGRVPLSDTLPLQDAMRSKVSLAGYNGAKASCRPEGNPDKDVLVFLFTFDGTTDDGDRLHGGVLRPTTDRCILGKTNGGKTNGTAGEAAFRGTYYAFFVEGIGDEPEAPAKIRLFGDHGSRTLTIDPEKHTLPARYAVHVDQDDVTLREPWSRSRIGLQINSIRLGRKEPRGSETPGPPYPVYVLHGGATASAGIAFSDFGTGTAYDPPPKKYDFYLLYLGS